MCSVSSTGMAEQQNSFTLYLVRHAEKQADGSRDPALTDAGKRRAEQLATWFQDKNLEDVWSSDYRRTRDTVAPLVADSGLELSIYDPRELQALAGTLLDKHHNALVVGHSNTTPELARLLCQCVVAEMDESEYDRLIVVTVSAGGTAVKTLTQNALLPLTDDPGP
jgi:phosphohistidine phosphatase SixA